MEQVTDTLTAGQLGLSGDLTEHLQSCTGCRTFYAQQAKLFRAMDSGLSAMANEPVPASLLPRVRARMEETYPVSPWFYGLLPVAAVLVIACLIALPLVRRSFRSGGVQVTVVPKRNENRVKPLPPQVEQPEQSTAPLTTRERSPRHFAHVPAARRPAQTVELDVLVSSEESEGLLQLAAAVPRSPQWAQAMLHPVELPLSQVEPMKPIEIANLEVQPLSEENQ
jgi:anti-sigma factor RsiW